MTSRRDRAGPLVFEFPPELMKEETANGRFSGSKRERRLFWCGANARAQKRLTLSTIVNRWKRESPFLVDFLANPKIQKFDTDAVRSQAWIVPPFGRNYADLWRTPSDPAHLLRFRAGSSGGENAGRIRASRFGLRLTTHRSPSRCN